VSTALYRRYRPESFAELIGQTQVTIPLTAALRGDRVNHAYLFSGPRGCGKTTSARILARCLNCAEGPTDTPCGVCPSCVELARDGAGSLDVVEIDAASHNKVEDARELRERAAFAPVRDRFKIFILDEAHMVTKDGFNALLKIVEEPPAHVKFIFATTEPEKVIGTIRSRTHHYPFRLVAPATMLEYLTELCESEGVKVADGVLPLVVRSGGGSVRDALSLLDQLIAGSEDGLVTLDIATNLLGYTDGTLLDSVIDAFATNDAAQVFAQIDQVIKSGQDPTRFVEDLLERLRDLIVVASVGAAAKTVLLGTPVDQIEKMRLQAEKFGRTELTYAAQIIASGLKAMSGATSPKLQLEIMAAKVLVPSQDNTELGSLTRIDRLERRIGLGGAAPVSPAAVASVAATPTASAPEASAATAASQVAATQVSPAPATSSPATPALPQTQLAPLTFDDLKASYSDVLDKLAGMSRLAWAVVLPQTLLAFDGEILDIAFNSEADLSSFKNGGTASPSELFRRAINEVLGVQVKYRAKVASSNEAPKTEQITQVAEPAAVPEPARMPEPAPREPEPTDEESAPERMSGDEAPSKIETINQGRNKMINTEDQVGDAVLRDIFNAKPIDGDK
jgi:DNA polymerase-3 subunit gamma/tau